MIQPIVNKAREALLELVNYLREAKGLNEEADKLIFIADNLESIGNTLLDFQNYFTEHDIDYSTTVIDKDNIKTSLAVESGYFRFLFDFGDTWLGHEVKIVNSLPFPPLP